MKQGLKLMMKQKGGSIINIASTVGLLALDPSFGEAASYVASKAGVIGLTKQGISAFLEKRKPEFKK
jgi:NAD(P)-dependent dehydrogenase (short-subunit alcohol dehydrogenase family)